MSSRSPKRQVVGHETRVKRDDRLADTSVWVMGQRRWVYLKGCVASQAQRERLVAEVRLIDDVEAVVDELMVGTSAPPPYAVDRSAKERDRPESRPLP